mmetsp:Transcript_112526/g.157806  ORF Transcript_112526/g.157806 Transcript_112526/m.157806 type:complete len:213 (+) Transcript_112526:209-847(+)
MCHSTCVCLIQCIHNAAMRFSISRARFLEAQAIVAMRHGRANLVEVGIFVAGCTSGQIWEEINQISRCNAKCGHFRWQLCTIWAKMHLIFSGMPMSLRNSTSTRMTSILLLLRICLCQRHVVSGHHLRSANPPETTPFRAFMVGAPGSNIPVNTLQSLYGSIFPREFSIAMKLVLMTICIKVILLDNKAQDLPSWPFCRHPRIPCEEKRVDM